MSSVDAIKTLDKTIKAQILIGASLALTLVGGVGGWAATTSLAGAVIAPATVVVESSKKKVQHDAGGIVAEIKVKNGDVVKRGDVLIRLDGTQTAAEIAALEKRLFDHEIRRRRLIAESTGKDQLELSAETLKKLESNPELKELVDVQEGLRVSRLGVREGERRQLNERIGQLESQVEGLRLLRESTATELKYFEEEVRALDELKSKSLVSAPRYNTLRRAEAEKRGMLGRTITDIARTESQISETRLQLAKDEMDARREILKELETIESESGQVEEQLRVAKDRQSKLDIVASDNGVIHELAVHTVGGVVRAGDTLASIVPSETKLVLDAKMQTIDRDQVHPGMTARVRFSAFNQRTTPEFVGHVDKIGSDQATDERTSTPYYVVRVVLDEDQLSRLGELEISPGMPAEVMMTSEPRTVLSYLMKPVSDQFLRAFREE